MLETSIDIAKQAGYVLMNYFGTALESEKKKDQTPVTEADLASNSLITRLLLENFPDHHVFSEESSREQGLKIGFNWIVDPLDGTSNFLNGLSYFCVSMACVKLDENGKQTTLLGVTHNPVTGDTYHAEAGKGAFKNGQRLSASNLEKIGSAFIACGYHGDDMSQAYGQGYLKISRMVENSRRLGSAALDLAQVAEGTFDFFFDSLLRPWDTAAGALMIQEAGGAVINFPGNGEAGSFTVLDRGIIAGSNKLVDEVASFFS